MANVVVAVVVVAVVVSATIVASVKMPMPNAMTKASATTIAARAPKHVNPAKMVAIVAAVIATSDLANEASVVRMPTSMGSTLKMSAQNCKTATRPTHATKAAQSAHLAAKAVVSVAKVVVSAANAVKMAQATTPPKLLTTWPTHPLLVTTPS